MESSLTIVKKEKFHILYSIRKSHSISLRILNLFKSLNTQPPLFKLYGMAMCLKLESLDPEILQFKI